MILLRTCSAGALALTLLSHGAALAQESDPHLALEAVESPDSLAWVKAQNDRTLPDPVRAIRALRACRQRR